VRSFVATEGAPCANDDADDDASFLPDTARRPGVPLARAIALLVKGAIVAVATLALALFVAAQMAFARRVP